MKVTNNNLGRNTMNINKVFKFVKSRETSKKFYVIHRESCRWAMNVHYVEAGPFDDTCHNDPSCWKAARNDSTFVAATRAAAVRGLVAFLCRNERGPSGLPQTFLTYLARE